VTCCGCRCEYCGWPLPWPCPRLPCQSVPRPCPFHHYLAVREAVAQARRALAGGLPTAKPQS
jgi:hypothetical protein